MALERIERARSRSRSGSANPTRAHVHPNSRKAGTFEDDFFYSYAKGETDRLYKKAVELLKRKNAVRRLARAEGRQLTEDERLVTLITPAAVRVFEQLTTLARTCAGKVFPTWEWIEAASGLSRASVGRGLSILATMGLIEKQRRCVPIDPPADRPKARNAQTSNVYRMSFPNRLARFLPRFLMASLRLEEFGFTAFLLLLCIFCFCVCFCLIVCLCIRSRSSFSVCGCVGGCVGVCVCGWVLFID